MYFKSVGIRKKKMVSKMKNHSLGPVPRGYEVKSKLFACLEKNKHLFLAARQ